MPEFALVAWGAALMALGFAAGWALARRSYESSRRQQQQALDQALRAARTDTLTGLANRLALDEQLGRQTAISRRYRSPLALALFDIDNLKAVNDRDGHAAGDELLRRFARLLATGAREADFVARLGGDEFAVLLPQTDLEGASQFARRLFARLASDPPPISASAGAAAYTSEEAAEPFMQRADAALLTAKRAGRGRLSVDDGRAEGVARPDRRN
ncbi:MAG: GGDEF domain-containing protein [Planctomycetaceae bacterium]